MRFRTLSSALHLMTPGERVRRVHASWLEKALSRRDGAIPRIPVRRVDQGGFTTLMAVPGGPERAEQWWQDAFSALEGFE